VDDVLERHVLEETEDAVEDERAHAVAGDRQLARRQSLLANRCMKAKPAPSRCVATCRALEPTSSRHGPLRAWRA
jgi:hypothetical protein